MDGGDRAARPGGADSTAARGTIRRQYGSRRDTQHSTGTGKSLPAPRLPGTGTATGMYPGTSEAILLKYCISDNY